jgi:DNA-binding CsgD family transcriptional regulator
MAEADAPHGQRGLRLTPRQRQILRLAAQGLSDKEIAARLGISYRTVRTHFERLYHTYGLRGRAAAVALYLLAAAEGGTGYLGGRLSDALHAVLSVFSPT